MNIDELYMQRCLQLAAMAEGHTSPNPMVGAVVVCNGVIIGEGYHRKCGEAHAEVNAISSVRDKSLLPHSTIYVSLEPCSHYGKTPPCCELIINSGIPRVVIGCLDPFPQVSGRGVERLRSKGIEVITGVLEEQCRWLNRKFMTYQQKNRPYIILKWAESADGYIDRERQPDEPATSFSTPVTRVWSHRLRATNDAIIVGTNTILTDNPSLTTRYWAGSNPCRITIDCNDRIPAQAAIHDDKATTLILGKECSRISVQEIVNTLYKHKIQSLIVEGGSCLLQSFIDASLWDEARIETTPITLKRGIPSPIIDGKKMQIFHHNTHHHTILLINRFNHI